MTDVASRARVLIVDDDRFYRELARDALVGALEGDVEVECYESSASVLEALGRDRADLVVSDLRMPGLSGLELLQRVRREHPGTEFILVTGNASVDSAVEALRMGAADYLRKPLQPEELVLVVERTLARQRLGRENDRLRDSLATIEACRSLATCLEPAAVYTTSLDIARQLLHCPRGLALYLRTSIPMSEAAELRGFSEEEGSALRRALAQQKPLHLEEISQLGVLRYGPVHDALGEAGLPASGLLAIPLRGEDAELGALFLAEDEKGFDAVAFARAGVLLGEANVALRNAERYQRAKERAFIDDVTEVYNARYLLEAIDREIGRAERYGSELSVLFLDIDRFKLVNDWHGHLVGSQALRQLSELLAQCVRQVDTLARYGGDEFTIVLVDTGEQEGLQISERIRRIVEETPFDAGQSGSMHLTCSVGLATHGIHGRTREELLDAADKAMYRAKSNGRNRVCSASELSG